MQITQLTLTATPGGLYGGAIIPPDPPGPKPSDRVTALGISGLPAKPYNSIVIPPDPPGPKPSDRVTTLGLTAVPSQVYPDTVLPPDPPGPKPSDRVTSLNTLATPGQIYIFQSTPVVGDKIRVYGILQTPLCEPRTGSVINFTLLEKIETDTVIIEAGLSASTRTDASGYFEISIYPGQYRLTIDCATTYDVILPDDVSEIDLRDLI